MGAEQIWSKFGANLGQIWGTQPPNQRRDLSAAVRQLRKSFAAKAKRDLLSWHGVGTLVAAFFPDGDRQYGSNVTEMLARELGAADEKTIRSLSNTLWQARTVAKTLNGLARFWVNCRNWELPCY